MKSSEDKLTIKQKRWIKAYIETGNATEAAMQAYDCKDRDSARALGSENLAKLNIAELMEDMGLTDVALINIGTEGMTKAIKQSMTGEVHPDYATRHRYWDTMLKLKRKLTDKLDITSGGESLIVIKADGNKTVPMANTSN
ncbi:terminase small subunit [Candidatus Dojkabacteria bacterium]|jgi:hypothetical protein|nr:terminase small subunit [Candidatus Dojkabacteria bacterium]